MATIESVAEDPTEWGVHISRTGSVLWPNRKTGPWRVICTWSNIDGYTRLTEVTIGSSMIQRGRKLTQTPITASTFRNLPLDKVAGLILRDLRSTPDSSYVGPPELYDDLLGTYVEGGRTGRRPLTTTELATVAAIYRDGGSQPTKAVADALNISRSAAAKRVVRAREAGLLEPTTQGRAGGPGGDTKATRQ
jgi:hypothetical protein